MKKSKIDVTVSGRCGGEIGNSLFLVRSVTSLPAIPTRRSSGGEVRGRDGGEKFIFTEPAERRFELSQFAESIIDERISKTELLGLSQIYTIAPKFADEATQTLLREEAGLGIMYSKSQARKRINTFINLRIRTWLDYLRKQDRGLATDSPETIEERNDDGDLVDFSQISDEPILSEDKKNPFHQDPLKVVLTKEEMVVFEKALHVMAKRHTGRSMEQLAVSAAILNRLDLVDLSILADLPNAEINYLAFHAERALSRIIDKLYPIKRSERQKKHKIRRTPFRVLKENYRGNTPLFNKTEKNGEIIIVFSKENNGAQLKESAEYPEYDDAA